MHRKNLVFFIQAHHEPRLYIPHALQQTYLQFFHDHPFSSHKGFHRVLKNYASGIIGPTSDTMSLPTSNNVLYVNTSNPRCREDF